MPKTFFLHLTFISIPYCLAAKICFKIASIIGSLQKCNQIIILQYITSVECVHEKRLGNIFDSLKLYLLPFRKVCYTLLKLGAEVACTDNNQWTPLMWASKLGYAKCCQELLSKEISLNNVNMEGDTALHIACRQGHVDIVNMLLGNGASLTVCNTQGVTCLECAVRAGNSDVATAMTKHSRYGLSGLKGNISRAATPSEHETQGTLNVI